jgi:hypothetical protein
MANAIVYTNMGTLGITPTGTTAKSAAEGIETLANLSYITMLGTANETVTYFPTVDVITYSKEISTALNISITSLDSAPKITYTTANKASGGGGTVVYYKMCARSLDNTSWQTWVVSQTPDFSGSQYGGGIPINTSTTFILATI